MSDLESTLIFLFLCKPANKLTGLLPSALGMHLKFKQMQAQSKQIEGARHQDLI